MARHGHARGHGHGNGNGHGHGLALAMALAMVCWMHLSDLAVLEVHWMYWMYLIFVVLNVLGVLDLFDVFDIQGVLHSVTGNAAADHRNKKAKPQLADHGQPWPAKGGSHTQEHGPRLRPARADHH